MLPLLEARLELQVPEIIFSPSIDQDAVDGFFSLVEGLADDIFKGAALIPRLAIHNGQENYQVCVCARMSACVCVCVCAHFVTCTHIYFRLIWKKLQSFLI